MTTHPFQLHGLPALSRSTVQRDELLRKDDRRLDELWRTGQVVLVDRQGRTPVRDGATGLATRPTATVADERPADAVLLGLDGDTSYWAVTAEEPMREGLIAPPGNSWGMATGGVSQAGEEWHDLRAVGDLLDDTAAGLFTTASGLTNWHGRARHCAKCGAAVLPVAAGWATHCTGCGREEYPRTDPAVICLVHDGAGVDGENVLLARQPIWPPHRYSVLAGFVETGESLEACVEREIAEEVGVPVSGIRYLGSQPWPFPRSIMIAFAAVADPDHPLVPADGEIEQARWYSRARVREAVAAGGQLPDLILPGPTSIAHQMLTAWAAA
ncbi:NAD(+) diphosphatase [Actinokineospora bangkokensis]|uniref:NAD(+) diphosphatase n=1 Tax=Actinokineospora bangkokensis TaxID=1193682 RepID=A0A1Q9LDT7_9PSEU|nr:NAD(+) diphosphatase [Actinokineospora bangkokensis]OLR90173.1 NADH pyrophosphatase [Actinokineospora bangkokensis]